ncbi:hypothetical protein DL98DRAFT_593070 [Cadophora sp. DSE1049]|nr:hypothetical protein DL98DRAFT_593070 [Cadophora sp. DSE1049]
MAAPNLNQLAVVLFAAPAPAPAIIGLLGLVNPVLQYSSMELATFYINQTQHNTLVAPGRNVSYVVGFVTPD